MNVQKTNNTECEPALRNTQIVSEVMDFFTQYYHIYNITMISLLLFCTRTKVSYYVVTSDMIAARNDKMPLKQHFTLFALIYHSNNCWNLASRMTMSINVYVYMCVSMLYM